MNDGLKTDTERRLSLFLRAFCALPFLTGLGDMITGVQPLVAAGARIATATAADATLNSQVAFWGAIWFGFGISLWWAAGDIRRCATPIRIATATLFLSGAARAYASLRYGWPAPVLVGAMALELIGSPLFWLWHRKVIRKS